MLYHLLYPLHEYHTVFNVFRYITFRAIYAVITALIIGLVMAPLVIQWLRARNIGERIREDGPKTHFSKKGTPTMGGIIIITALAGPTLLWADILNSYVWVALVATLLFGAIGLHDDYTKLMGVRNGISARAKMGYQLGAAFIVVGMVYVVKGGDPQVTTVSVPFFKNLTPDLGLLYIPFAMLVIVGCANAVNLTDGLDGLAIGPIFIAFLTYVILCYTGGHAMFAQYLGIPFVGELSELTVFCAAVVGASLGFLWYNFYPAMIFMGNVGSTALGGALGAVAVLSKQEVILVVIGGVFVAEALSVMLQVLWFKTTGRRIFRMAPLHHHFEHLGWPEPQVIVRFWIVSAVLALVALSTLKLR